MVPAITNLGQILTKGREALTFPSMIDIDKALRSAKEAAKIGREVILSHFGRLHDVQEKDQAGLVSEADRESEVAITQYLRREHPEFWVLGEEESFIKHGFGPVEVLRHSGVWLVDPLDGTTNYVHRLPFFCVSIGLMFQNEMQVGVIDVPVLKKVYWAAKDRGAFVNDEPIRVSEHDKLRESLLATGFSNYNQGALKTQLEIFGDLVGEARGIRRAGSAAMDLCWVAEGVFDGYWEGNLKPWDTAAGALIVKEAGGIVTSYDGRGYDPFDSSLVAANPRLHPTLKNRISERWNK